MPTIRDLVRQGYTREQLGISQDEYDAVCEIENTPLEQRAKAATLPPLVDMARNLKDSMAEWRAAGFRFVSDQEHETRLSVCKGCEYLTEHKQCLKCGCFMEFKSRLAGMKCPIGKW